MNELVAVAEGGPALSDCYASLKIIGPASNILHQEASGGWAAAEGLVGAVGAVTDLAEFAIDPIASMAGSVAGFLLDYMPPLPHMLDSLAGDPAVVEAKAATWNNVADRVNDSADELDARVREALAQWSGPAATAYGQFGQVLRDAMYAMGTMCSGVGGVMQAASGVVTFVRAIVRDVIADLVGKPISWAAQVASTAGLGASWVIPQATTAIGIRVAKVTDWLTRLKRAVQALAKYVNDANKALSTAIPPLRRAGEHLSGNIIAPARTGVEAVHWRDLLESATSVSGTLGKGVDAGAQGAEQR